MRRKRAGMGTRHAGRGTTHVGMGRGQKDLLVAGGDEDEFVSLGHFQVLLSFCPRSISVDYRLE